ncbi:quinone-dependent dihydroorotate dehydrogenase [Candidatus Woesearchaeota archaeon]|nr:quinone-dependent dihydroorotate dehydrogenase [Candidatus Woesearchaeota archaeon]
MFKTYIRPLLFAKDPENAHESMLKILQICSKSLFIKKIISFFFSFQHKKLHVDFGPFHFHNPLGLAAGFDKNAKVYSLMQCFGFSHVEVGTITAHPQKGNEKPRVFRLAKDHALINRLGFPNEGASRIQKRISRTKKPRSLILGINIGKSKKTPLDHAAEDYLQSFSVLFPFGDYFVLNISSPNTPELRELQKKERLLSLVQHLQKKNQEIATSFHVFPKPLFVKIAPDLSYKEIDDIVDIVQQTHCTGIIATNTTLARPQLHTSLQEQGGLSGQPLKKRSREIIAYLYHKTQGTLPLIGVGGVATAKDAYSMIAAGASLVQLYTGFIYEGPSCVKKINKGLLTLLQKEGFKNIQEARGSQYHAYLPREMQTMQP